ncbi:MAG: TolB-like 6-bladed beta-propeller domain-containing protein [Odoribacter sp.]|nr:TolB-like 6-bladed beta-propeller domain-containing protein [Odoribacter sp.]
MKNLYLFLMAVMFCACQEHTMYDKQTYAKFPIVEKLQGRDVELHDSIFFTYPQILVEDSLCCIYDLAAQEGYYCHIFKFPEFVYKYSMVKVGRGVNEIVNPSCYVRLYKNGLYIADNANQKLLCYNMLDTSASPVVFSRLKDFVFDFTILNDTSVAIVSPVSTTHRIRVYNSTGDVMDSLLLLPEVKRAVPSNFRDSEIWTSVLEYDAQNNMIALATQDGEVLEFVNLTTQKHHIAVGPGGKPEFGYKGKDISFPGKIVGFKNISIYDGYVYALFSGISREDFIWNNADEDYKMQVYDKTGKPVKQYIFDRPISSCYVDLKHNRIYATDKTSEWMLSVFEL